MIQDMRTAVEEACTAIDYTVIDAQARVTGRDFLLKIWHLIASSPLSIGLLHEDIPQETQANIFYELGVAQAMGKETVVVKSPTVAIPSDLVRSEYIVFDNEFSAKFSSFLSALLDLSDHYELVADQLEKNPLMALDYLKRAYLISGDERLKDKAQGIADEADFKDRAENSLEMLATNF